MQLYRLGATRPAFSISQPARPAIADIACYPCVKRAPEGRIPLEPYPAVMAWLGRCESLPGWLKLE